MMIAPHAGDRRPRRRHRDRPRRRGDRRLRDAARRRGRGDGDEARRQRGGAVRAAPRAVAEDRRRPREAARTRSTRSCATSRRRSTRAGTRRATATFEGGTIPAGHPVLLITGAATRDPRAFEHADAFDIERTPGHLDRVRARRAQLPRRRARAHGEPHRARGAGPAVAPVRGRHGRAAAGAHVERRRLLPRPGARDSRRPAIFGGRVPSRENDVFVWVSSKREGQCPRRSSPSGSRSTSWSSTISATAWPATRFPDEIAGTGWDYGVPMGYLHELVDTGATRTTGARRRPRSTRSPSSAPRIDGQQIHFVHARSRASRRAARSCSCTAGRVRSSSSSTSSPASPIPRRTAATRPTRST